MEADRRCVRFEVCLRDLTNTVISFENEIMTMHPNLFGNPIQPSPARLLSGEFRAPGGY